MSWTSRAHRCAGVAALAGLLALPAAAAAQVAGPAAATPEALAAPVVIPLWPEGVPGALPDGGDERIVDGRVYNVHNPTLTYYAPTAPPVGTAVIVCPGGGYVRLAIANEGAGVTKPLRALGVAVFVLKYRLAEYRHPAQLRDVLRAVRLVRSRAEEFGVRPDRVGVFGASAGGHLAAMAGALYDAGEGRTGAALDAVTARPDFVALLYPVVSMREPFVHPASRRNLLGADPPATLIDRLSVDTQVRTDMPPVFVVHTAEDESVPAENSLALVAALRRARVPVEFHFYERGPHGFGVRQGLGTTSGWVDRWMDWMRAHGWLDAASREPQASSLEPRADKETP